LFSLSPKSSTKEPSLNDIQAEPVPLSVLRVCLVLPVYDGDLFVALLLLSLEIFDLFEEDFFSL